MRPARCVPDGDAAREHPAVRAVGMQHAVLALEVWREPFDVRRDSAPQSVDIIPVDSSEPLVRSGGNCARWTGPSICFQRWEKKMTSVRRFQSHKPSFAPRTASA